MLATTGIFYSNDWPKRLWRFLTRKELQKDTHCPNLSPHCIYEKISRNDDDNHDTCKKDNKKNVNQKKN